MTIIPISHLSRAECAMLGVNILTARRVDHRLRPRRRRRSRLATPCVTPRVPNHVKAA